MKEDGGVWSCIDSRFNAGEEGRRATLCTDVRTSPYSDLSYPFFLLFSSSSPPLLLLFSFLSSFLSSCRYPFDATSKDLSVTLRPMEVRTFMVKLA